MIPGGAGAPSAAQAARIAADAPPDVLEETFRAVLRLDAPIVFAGFRALYFRERVPQATERVQAEKVHGSVASLVIPCAVAFLHDGDEGWDGSLT
jgi:hypothetical protein